MHVDVGHSHPLGFPKLGKIRQAAEIQTEISGRNKLWQPARTAVLLPSHSRNHSSTTKAKICRHHSGNSHNEPSSSREALPRLWICVKIYMKADSPCSLHSTTRQIIPSFLVPTHSQRKKSWCKWAAPSQHMTFAYRAAPSRRIISLLFWLKKIPIYTFPVSQPLLEWGPSLPLYSCLELSFCTKVKVTYGRKEAP